MIDDINKSVSFLEFSVGFFFEFFDVLFQSLIMIFYSKRCRSKTTQRMSRTCVDEERHAQNRKQLFVTEQRPPCL